MFWSCGRYKLHLQSVNPRTVNVTTMGAMNTQKCLGLTVNVYVNDVDEDNSSDEKDETPATASADNATQDANDCNLDEEILLYTEFEKLKGCTYHEHFQTVLKSCKLVS